MTCLPAPGDQVIILPCRGSLEQGVIVGSCFSSKQPPPLAPIGEIWITHSSGTTLKLTNDGHVVIVGDLYVSGDVYDQHGSMAGIRNYHNSHTHLDSRGGATTIPTKAE
jgi:phage gp45-like